MIIELGLHTIDNEEWWFDLGVSYQTASYPRNKKHLFTIALIFFTIYFRWQINSQVAELVDAMGQRKNRMWRL